MLSWLFSSPPPALREKLGIRLEAIGGQGAHSAGKILVEAGVLGLGLAGNHFSSFGSEKRGSLVRSYVRLAPGGTRVRSASAVRHPRVLGIFHDSLLATHPEVLEGALEGTTLVLNTARSSHDLALPTGTRLSRVISGDFLRVAASTGAGLNCVMLGALSRALPELPAELLEGTLEKFFQRAPPALRKANVAGFRAGRSQASDTAFHPDLATLPHHHSPLPELGYRNAPIGGLIVNPGNTVLKDNSASRKGAAPRFFADVCFHCGRCDLVCPDYCFVWKQVDGKPQLQGIDYRFCKGCAKCVAACPVSALLQVPEAEIPPEERAQRLFPEVTSPAIEARWHTLDWSRADAELKSELGPLPSAPPAGNGSQEGNEEDA